jgi:hypothetical protein
MEIEKENPALVLGMNDQPSPKHQTNQAHDDRTITIHKDLSGRTQFKKVKTPGKEYSQLLEPDKDGGNNTYMDIHSNVVIQNCAKAVLILC